MFAASVQPTYGLLLHWWNHMWIHVILIWLCPILYWRAIVIWIIKSHSTYHRLLANVSRGIICNNNHGNPQLDGPISDFIGKYGQPIQSSLSSDSFWADQAQTIRVDVTPQGTIVHEILVSVPGNWSVSQTKTFCEQFLPPDASPFNTTGNVTDYQSSIGEIMMQLGAGSCLLTTH